MICWSNRRGKSAMTPTEANVKPIDAHVPAVMTAAFPPIPPASERFGFSVKQTGGHMARSMMLDELTLLVGALPAAAAPGDYRQAILENNSLGKPTFSSRDNSFRHLRQLYSLDPARTLFRLLRRLAAEDAASLPLLAMICAVCRDPQLRHSFTLIDALKPGEVLLRQRMEDHLEAGFPGRFSPVMKATLAQHVNTTWTAAGHLTGRVRKVRTRPVPRQAATVYALLSGYLLGLRGEILLRSTFTRLVTTDPAQVTAHLAAASACGWVRFHQAGGVTEIDFAPLLTADEQEHCRGPS